MRRSKTVTLFLCSSRAVFGIGGVTGCDSGYYDENGNWVESDQYDGWEPEPVFVDGVMGVYHPTTMVFVPHTSPQFAATTTLIKTNHVSAMKSGGVSSARGGFGAMGGKSGIAS